MKRFNLSAWAVAHPALVLFLILALAVGGTLSFLRLGRGEDPSFTIKNVIVTAVWPGATAQEMQDQVADRIEKRLQELPYFDKVITYTKPGFTAMNVGFRDNTPAREVPQLFYQLRKKLTDLRSDLPRDLIGPNVNDEFGDVDSVLYMMTGDGADYAQLKTVAEALRQRLLKVPGVTKVNLYGIQDPKIFVEFSHAKLATLGIAPQALFRSLQRQNAVAPAGVVETGAQRIPCGSRRARRRAGGRGDPGRGERAACSASATSRRSRAASRTRRTARAPARQARARRRRRDDEGRQHPGLRPGVQAATDAFMAAVPQGFALDQVADQPKVVDEAICRVRASFVEALGDRARVSLLRSAGAPASWWRSPFPSCSPSPSRS
jgi:multidrug efflux pump subunit AcrB